MAPELRGAAGTDAKPLYLWVHAVVPEGDLLRGHDVENYLTPLALELRELHIVLAVGTKGLHGAGFVEIGTVEPEAWSGRPGWTTESLRATGSVDRRDWKERLRQQLQTAGVTEASAGPLQVAMSIRGSARRNWINLWKPLGDSLGPVLGEANTNVHNPRDDRIVMLSLHRIDDESIGWDVACRVEWRKAPTAWAARPLDESAT